MNNLALSCVALLMAGAAQSSTLDFTTLPTGPNGNSVVLDGTTVTNASGGSLFVGSGAAGQANGFCSLSLVGFSCEADTEIIFGTVVSNLSFWLDGSNPGDNLSLMIYGVGNTLLATLGYTVPDQLIDLSAYGNITRLYYADSSTGAGYGYSRFEFDKASSVPLPAGLPLLLGAFGGLAALRKGRRNS